jgi:hypothetical protein
MADDDQRNPAAPTGDLPTAHCARRADCFVSVAAIYGFPITSLWDANPDLRSRRASPYLLAEEDEVKLPPRPTKDVEIRANQTTPFVRSGASATLQLQLLDRDGRPRAALDYTLEVAGEAQSGTTDSDGNTAVHPVPPESETAWLVIAPDEIYELAIGELDPPDAGAGITQRLANLGFARDGGEEDVDLFADDESDEIPSRPRRVPPDGAWEPVTAPLPFTPDPARRLRAALRAFQGEEGIGVEPRGELDDETSRRLSERSGC